MATYTGKSIVVTGASSGIGKALCLALAPQRPRLVLAARDVARLEEVAAAATSERRATSRAARTNRGRCGARARHSALPIPEEAPVTTIDLPV